MVYCRASAPAIDHGFLVNNGSNNKKNGTGRRRLFQASSHPSITIEARCFGLRGDLIRSKRLSVEQCDMTQSGVNKGAIVRRH